jgi:hypothetical protein
MKGFSGRGWGKGEGQLIQLAVYSTDEYQRLWQLMVYGEWLA